jgi:hypothetical protein
MEWHDIRPGRFFVCTARDGRYLMLRCVSAYKSSLGSWQAGDTVDNAELEKALAADSPGSWITIEAVFAKDEVHVTTSIDSEDKIIRRGRSKKVQDEIIE